MIGEEGKFSMYIDAVNQTFGPSSYSDKDVHSFTIEHYNIEDDIFKHFPYGV